MSRVRLVLLGVLAACALSAAAASTPAFAGSCTGSTNWVFCSGTGFELGSAGPTLVLGLAGLVLAAASIGTAEVKVHCRDVHFHGLLLALGHFHGTLLFLWCQLIKPTSCKLSTSEEKDIRAPFLGRLTGGKTATITGTGTGEEFVTIEIVEKSGCSIVNRYVIKGSQLIEIPKGEAVGVEEQEGVAKKSGSHLFFGVEPLSANGTGNAMLAAGGAWLNMFGV
jgi:hypothetical protein